MEDCLVQALDALKLPNGEPDLQARAASLTALLTGAHLNVNELRLLKGLMSTVALHKDIVSSLPVELAILVTNHLSEEDIWACLKVSKAWRATFLNDRILYSLADRLFPHLVWELSASKGNHDESRARIGPRFLLFLEKRLQLTRSYASRRRQKFESNYNWDTESNFRLEGQEYSQFPGSDGAVETSMLYAHGRIAWQPESHTLVIDNLASMLRNILIFPGGKLLGPMMHLVALGNELVVACMDRYLLAWDLKSAQFERITLPALPIRCTTVGRQVAVTVGDEVYVWKFGAALLGLDLLGLDFAASSPYPRYAQAFIHPHQEDVIFVRQVFKPTESTLQFKVHKFVHRRYDRTFQLDVVMRRLPEKIVCSSLMGFVPLTHRWIPWSGKGDVQGYFLYEFDIYHESFIKRHVPAYQSALPFRVTVDDDFVVELGTSSYCVW
jgi:hypothetical protein